MKIHQQPAAGIVAADKPGHHVKPQLYGIIGITIGLLAFMSGLDHISNGNRSEFGGILLLAGIFIFGCGLIAAAIGARK